MSTEIIGKKNILENSLPTTVPIRSTMNVYRKLSEIKVLKINVILSCSVSICWEYILES